MGERLTCDCGYTWFERKTVMRLQLGSKYMPHEDFVPTETLELARCLFCGRYFGKQGEEVDASNLAEDD